MKNLQFGYHDEVIHSSVINGSYMVGSILKEIVDNLNKDQLSELIEYLQESLKVKEVDYQKIKEVNRDYGSGN